MSRKLNIVDVVPELPSNPSQEQKPVERRSIMKKLLAMIGGGALIGGANQMFAASRNQYDMNSMMGADPFLGEIYIAGFNFAPRGYATCDGQILSIAQNTALFSLLGTTFGGNGQTTFALPDLRGRVPMHFGQGPGLSARTLGEGGGQETVTLTLSQSPQHTHSLMANGNPGTFDVPNGHLISRETAGTPIYGDNASPIAMAANAIGNSGGNQPHNNMQPYLVLNFYIALEGIFPSRN